MNLILSPLMPGATSGRTRNTARMTEILEAEALSSDTENKKKRRKRNLKGKTKETVLDFEVDAEYANSSSESGTSSDEPEGDKSDEVEISNKEVSFILRTTF
jgi:hypothetical protein